MKFAGNVAMRSEFEKLSEIERLIKEGNASYHDGNNWYWCKNIDCGSIELALDAAWYVYQEQQQKIDSMKSRIQDIWTSLDDRQSKEHIIESCESIIKELLK